MSVDLLDIPRKGNVGRSYFFWRGTRIYICNDLDQTEFYSIASDTVPSAWYYRCLLRKVGDHALIGPFVDINNESCLLTCLAHSWLLISSPGIRPSNKELSSTTSCRV